MKFPSSPQVLWCVNDHVTARQLLALDDVAIHVCADGTDRDTPKNLLVNARSSTAVWTPNAAGTPTTPVSAFQAGGTADDADFDVDDWSAAVSNGQVHVVRRRQTGSFDHAILDAAGDTTAGYAIPATPTTLMSGLFLAPYGDGLVLFALDANAATHVLYTVLHGQTWSAWKTLVSIGTSGGWLAGSAPGPNGKPAILWTEATGSSFAIAGALLP
jgi:hypothetical protein